MGKGAKIIMVLLESMSGSGHRIIKIRPKLSEKLEILYFDPLVNQHVLYREKKKVRTL